MAEGDFSVYAKIQADTSNFEKGMKKAQTSATNLSNTFGSLSKVITKALSLTGVVIGTKAIVDFGKASVQSATQATKQFNILNNTIKATGADAWTSTKEMEDLAKSLSDSTNYSVTEIEKMQSVLLGFRDITGDTFEEASNAILDMATVMGMDLTSAVQTVGKALDDPIKGLDSLRRQGFAFTDEQKAELTQLVKTGDKMKAQKIILDELSKTYGNAAKAGQDSFAKQTHAIENFKDALGGKLLPLVKSFAEDNANMINSLRDSLEDIDFNEIGAVIKVTFNGVKTAITNVLESIKPLSSQFKNFISGINFEPLISVVNNLAAALKRIGQIKLDQSLEGLKNLKDIASSLAGSIDLTKFSRVINLAINGFVYLYEEVNTVFDTLKDNIKTVITNIWNTIKSIFEASNAALKDSETDIKSWKDFFYSQFNNVFKIAQDMVQSIAHVLKGDWKVAWEYAKLAVLRIVDGLMDAISTMLNAFPGMVNKFITEWNKFVTFINKGRKKLGMEEIDLVPEFKNIDLSGIAGVQDKIKEVEKNISDLTGAKADKNLKDLQNFSTNAGNIIGGFVDRFKESVDEQKRALDNLRGEYDAGLTGSDSDAEKDAKNKFKIYSEWDEKLLKQKLDNLKEHGKEYTQEYHELQLELIDVEKERAKQADSTGAETEKINEYYENEIVEENERAEKEKRKHVAQTVAIIGNLLKNMAANAVAVFKKIASTIKNVFSTIGNFIKNTFSGIKNIFSKLFDFNIDDALDNLLKIEDTILTFFVETLPNMPSFFESAFNSVVVLVDTLMNSIDWEQIKGFLDSIVNIFVENAPKIVEGIVTIFTKIVSTVSDVFVENAPKIVEALGSMFFSIIEALPEIISKVISALGAAISSIGKYITENADRLRKDLSNIVKAFVNSISEFIKNGGWKNILDALLVIQKAIEDAITSNMDDIVAAIEGLLPDLIEMLKKSIVSASETLGKLAPKIIPLILDLILAFIEVAFSDEVIESSFEAISGIIEGLIKGIIKLIPKIINKFLVNNVNKVFMIVKLVKAIIEGIISAFTDTDWGEVIWECFMGFIKAFKDLFGIHSPSTLFEEFGGYIIEGLWNGIKNLGSWLSNNIKNFFSAFIDIIKNIFSGVGDWFKSVFTKAWDNIKNAFSGAKDWASNAWNGIKEGFSNVASWFSDTFSSAWNSIKNAFSGVSNWFSSTFSSAWNGIQSAFNGATSFFRNLFSNIGSSISSFVSSAWSSISSVASYIGSSIGSALNSVWSSVSSTVSYIGNQLYSGVQSAISRVKDAISSVGRGIRNFFGFANGTQQAPRGLALVGEAGPELVRFNGGEQVINNHNTQKLLSKSGKEGNTFNVTFNNVQDTTAYTMLQQLKAYNRQMAINGVI